jgi:hypothetical protein
VAEVKPATPITQAEPTTTPEVKQTEMNKTGTMALLPQSEYEDDSTDRQNSIVSNLNQYRQNAPQFMSSLQSFKDNFAYDKRSDTQKKLLENWFQ